MILYESNIQNVNIINKIQVSRWVVKCHLRKLQFYAICSRNYFPNPNFVLLSLFIYLFISFIYAPVNTSPLVI